MKSSPPDWEIAEMTEEPTDTTARRAIQNRQSLLNRFQLGTFTFPFGCKEVVVRQRRLALLASRFSLLASGFSLLDSRSVLLAPRRGFFMPYLQLLGRLLREALHALRRLLSQSSHSTGRTEGLSLKLGHIVQPARPSRGCNTRFLIHGRIVRRDLFPFAVPIDATVLPAIAHLVHHQRAPTPLHSTVVSARTKLSSRAPKTSATLAELTRASQ
mmetsp:Transcript_4441/g.17484  ORF Transcript_4441/g.17484 Transcript_4441/m.17484 type:complete len:214 (+) Transcript_4441:1297-1938(+)